MRVVSLLAVLLSLAGCTLLGRQVSSELVEDPLGSYALSCGEVDPQTCRQTATLGVRQYRLSNPGMRVTSVEVTVHDGTFVPWVCGDSPTDQRFCEIPHPKPRQ